MSGEPSYEIPEEALRFEESALGYLISLTDDFECIIRREEELIREWKRKMASNCTSKNRRLYKQLTSKWVRHLKRLNSIRNDLCKICSEEERVIDWLQQGGQNAASQNSTIDCVGSSRGE